MGSSLGDVNPQIEGGTDGTIIGNVLDKLKVVISDEQNKTFSVLTADQTIGNNKSMLSIVNASGSAVIVKIREIKIINTQVTSVTGVISIFDIKRITGHSAGTTVTPCAYDTSDSLSGSITVRTGSTVAGETVTLKRYKWSSDEWGSGPSDVESDDHSLQSLIPIYRVMPYCKPITLRAEEGISIKHTTNSTAGSFTIEVVFTEETV